MLLAQAVPATPVTIEGAWLLIIVSLGLAVPGLLAVLKKILEAWVRRIDAGTDVKLLELDSFKELKDEVTQLKAERVVDKQLIATLQGQVIDLQTRLLRAERAASRLAAAPDEETVDL